MREYEMTLTVFGKLYEMSFDLIIEMLREKHGMKITEDGALLLTVNHEDELTQITIEIQSKCYAARPSIVVVSFYEENEEALSFTFLHSIYGN